MTGYAKYVELYGSQTAKKAIAAKAKALQDSLVNKPSKQSKTRNAKGRDATAQEVEEVCFLSK